MYFTNFGEEKKQKCAAEAQTAPFEHPVRSPVL